MGLQHPMITRIERTGYPEPEPEIYGSDALNNAVLVGDEILCIEDIYFLVHALEPTAIEVLEELGATYSIAEK